MLRSYEGLRIPTNALRMNEDNQLGVYCVVGKVACTRLYPSPR